MYKMIIATALAVLVWAMPTQSRAVFQPDERPVLPANPGEADALGAITPVSARLFIHIGPKGAFGFGRFGGKGFYRFGNRGYRSYRPYPFMDRYYGNRYGYSPFYDRYSGFSKDRFFYDRYSRFYPGLPPSNYSPFGTRRPGW